MERRNFLRRAASFLAAMPALAQKQSGRPINGRLTNDDEHPMGKPTNQDDRPETKTLAGEDGATMKYSSPPHQVAMRAIKPRVLAPQPGVTAVTTRSFSNNRDGCNLTETTLTPANIPGLTKLYSYVLPDDLRGMEAQPLIVPNVTLKDGRTRDLCVLASMGNTIYAYDAHDANQLYWSRNLGDPIQNSKAIDGWMINDHWGILSTPVIDQGTARLYCVTWTSVDGTFANAVHTFRSISLADGSDANPPLSLEGAGYNPGFGLPIQTFKSTQRKQRSSLSLLTLGGRLTVIIPFGTIRETASNARGWIVAIDVATNSIGATFTTTSKYYGGGIWMAGQGIASDEKYLYALTGNGSFDAQTEWGECFLKLLYTPPANGAAGSIKVVDWWSPYSDSGRAGGPQDGDHITTDIGDGWDDMDLGSGGCVYCKSKNVVVGGGKDGILYVLNAANLGKTQRADFLNPAVNYAKLAAPPNWGSYYNPGNAAPQKFTDLNQIYGGLTHHFHSSPLLFESANHGTMLFCAGENGPLRAWQLKPDPTYLGTGAEVASASAARPPGGMPGMMLSLSANGQQNAIVWATVPLGDANKYVTQGYVAAYDATNITNQAMRLLWKSPQYTYNKFDVAVVSGGKLYVPTYDGKVDVYGLKA